MKNTQERTWNPKKHPDQRRKRPTAPVTNGPYSLNRAERLANRAKFRRGHA